MNFRDTFKRAWALFIVSITSSLISNSALWATDFDVVINEIHYNPLSGDDRDEYIELFNRGGTKVDLSGWRFSEGLTFIMPFNTILGPKEYLVISPDAPYAQERYGIDNVLGAYVGRLSNGGEIIALSNREGDVVSRVHYGDSGVWAHLPDGSGPSLERIDPHGRADYPYIWESSFIVDGTPGQPNSTLISTDAILNNNTILDEGDLWSYRRGNEPYPEGWRSLGFDAVDWDQGPSGFGFSDDDDMTVIEDMEDNFLSIAVRTVITLTQEDLDAAGSAFMEISYDDGIVGYLNETEIVLENLERDEDGFVPHFNDATDQHEAGEFETFTIPLDLLQVGENVLAFQVHNANLGSGDLSFIPRLILSPQRGASEVLKRGDISINEVKPTEGEDIGFIEFFNRGEEEINISGFRLYSSLGHEFILPNNTSLEAGEWISISATALGFSPQLNNITYGLTEADGKSFVDAFNPEDGPLGETGFSFGRFPDGDADGFVMASPTSGASNVLEREDRIVINEFNFHPPFIAPSEDCPEDCSDNEQWIELHNRADESIEISGWGLTSGVNFDFPDNTEIAAGGYIVVASSVSHFLASHPGFDETKLFGDWSRNLSHSSDTINLRDRLGNLVDHVKYGDGSPRNDEEPIDDVDDGTFRAAKWPSGADGDGPTMELLHPDLNNRHGFAWGIGPEGGTPGAENSIFDATPVAVIGGVRHSPAIPNSSETVTVSCKISTASSIDSAQLIWHVDGQGGEQSINLVDDGTGADEVAGDGRYTASIPPQDNEDIIAYRFSVTATGSEEITYPLPPEVEPYPGFDGPFYLYQVINDAPRNNGSANYYLIMTDEDEDELSDRDLDSDVKLYGTFIGIDTKGDVDVHQLVGVRYRGDATRRNDPKPFRINFPPEDRFDGIDNLNLNSDDTDTEILAGDLFHRANMPGPSMWTVNLTFRGDLETVYIRKENMDPGFLNRFFGDASDGGNLYRARDPETPGNPFQGDLTFLGETADDYRAYYTKHSNKEEDDYSDIIELCRVFDLDETSDEDFPDLVEQLIDVNQWARYFAAQACITNSDGSIHNRTGEDYALYKVPDDSPRDDAGKILLLPWDLEETYESETEPLFRTQLPNIRRFLTHERFAHLYYCNLRNLREGVFSRGESRQRFRLIDFIYSFGTIDRIDATITDRLGFIDQNVPSKLNAGAIDGNAAESGGLIAENAIWKFFRGTEEPTAAPLAWTEIDFDDGDWEQGPAGIGYDDGDDATLLLDMEDNYSSVYFRHVFNVTDPDSLPAVVLNIDYDDGFRAYLNGTPIMGREVDGLPDVIPYDAFSSDRHEAGTPEQIPLGDFQDLLVEGDNVLAIHGLNDDLSSSDFSMHPSLIFSTAPVDAIGCGTLLYAGGDTITLSGLSDACLTRSVLVDGQEASWDPFRAQWIGSANLNVGENFITVEAFDESGNNLDTLEVKVIRTQQGLTPVGGPIVSNTTWDAANSPYLMTDNVIVTANARLTIEPGTVIYAEADNSLIVRGELDATGTEDDPIRFRAANCQERWGGIAFDGTGVAQGDYTHVLRHASIEFGDNPSGYEGCVAPTDAKLLVENCSFQFLTANAIDGVDARFEVRNSTFVDILEGVHGTNSTVIVLDSTMEGMLGDRDAIDFDGDGNERSRIEGCIFLDGSDDGIDLGSTTVDIRDNVFINIQDKAISIEENGDIGRCAITGNLVFNCGTAMALKSGLVVREVHNNTLVGNQEGLNLFAKGGASDGGHATVHSSIIWNNIRDIQVDSLSTLELSYSNASIGVWPGEGNISIDPQFVDVDGFDFSLNSNSPCIQTGLEGVDMGAIPYDGPVNGFIRGDSNADDEVNFSDAVHILGVLFLNETAPDCYDRMDVDDDGRTTIGDPITLLLHLFEGGESPKAPFPNPGIDPTADELPCNL